MVKSNEVKMKLYFVSADLTETDDSEYGFAVAPQNVEACLTYEDAQEEAVRNARTYPGTKFVIHEGKALASFECEPLPVKKTDL